MRSRLLALPVVIGVLAAVPADASAALRGCPQSDRANGITAVKVDRMTCRAGFRLAKRTNAIKCFLNGDACTHRYRGRLWGCQLVSKGRAVRCLSGVKRTRYRIG
jgi:hypothetical protein